jgi:hypothetical protein
MSSDTESTTSNKADSDVKPISKSLLSDRRKTLALIEDLLKDTDDMSAEQVRDKVLEGLKENVNRPVDKVVHIPTQKGFFLTKWLLFLEVFRAKKLASKLEEDPDFKKDFEFGKSIAKEAKLVWEKMTDEQKAVWDVDALRRNKELHVDWKAGNAKTRIDYENEIMAYLPTIDFTTDGLKSMKKKELLKICGLIESVADTIDVKTSPKDMRSALLAWKCQSS